MTVPELPIELSEEIRAASWTGLKALPRRGAEIGGLLTASRTSPTVADGLELVVSEYLYGPSYRLSPAGLQALRERVTIVRESGKRVVAFFRSSTGEAFSVTGYDEEAIETAIPGTNLVLMAKPFLTGKANVRWFSRREGGPWSQIREFQLSPSQPQPTAPAGIEMPEPAGIHTPAPEVYAPTAKSTLRPWILGSVGGLSVGAAATCFYLYPVKPAPRPGTPSRAAAAVVPVSSAAPNVQLSSLGLQVRREARDLRLSWNRTLPELKAAKLGLLEVDDGSQTHLIFLKPEQITQGSLLYTPGSEDVSFRLVVNRSDSVALSDSVRFDKTAPAVKPVPAAREMPAAVEARREPEPPRVNPAWTPPEPAAAPAPSAVPAQLTTAAAPPPKLPVPVEEALLARLPESRPNPASSAPALALNVALPSPPAIPAASAPQAQRVDFHPPRPLQRPNPDLSNVPRTLITGNSDIRIQVRVDQNGRVTEAFDVASRPANRFISGLAVAAARRWVFEPATEQGRKVAADYNINFHFATSPNER